MRRRLKWIRVAHDDYRLMQTARGVKIKSDLPPGTMVYIGSRGNIKPMPEVFGIVATMSETIELNERMRKKYGANWREHPSWP